MIFSLELVHFLEHLDGEEAAGRLPAFADELLAVFPFAGALLHGEEGRHARRWAPWAPANSSSAKSLKHLVGPGRFELATSCTPSNK